MTEQVPPDPRNSMRGVHDRAFRAWIVAVAALGMLVLVVVLLREQWSAVPQLGPAFFVLGGLLLISELRPLFTAGGRDANGVVLSITFAFALLLRYDLGIALALQALAVLLSDSANRKAPWRTLFNVGQYTLSWSAAWLVMGLCGHTGSLTSPLPLDSAALWPALAGAVTFFVTNELLVGRAIATKSGLRLREVLAPQLGYELLTSGALLALAPVVALAAEAGVGFVPLLLPSLFAVYAVGSASRRSELVAHTDVLTGLANRTRLRLSVAHAVADGPMSLVLLDLDRFKEVNDTLGHHVGDQLLTVVARRLQAALRPGDTVSRLGGDEFALVLPGADADAAVLAASRLRDALAEPFELGGLLVDVAASAGVASAPEHGTDVDELLQHADVAMYLSKESGEVEIYDTARDHNSTLRLAVLGELRRALELDELELHYQPKADMRTGTVVGVEALVRWRHPVRGLVPPDEFIPLAERSGLIGALTGWVIDAGLRQAAIWRARGWQLSLAVNVTVRDLCGPDLVDQVSAALTRYGIPAHALQLEVTEGSLFADSARARTTLHRLEKLGVTLSLDDFGTGWSSLVQLRQLPVSEIKVDRSFVSRMATDPRDHAIVQSVVDLARGLGMRVVAEGVEDEPTWDLLRGLGCDRAQGWYLARALPVVELTTWLEGHYDPEPVAV